MGINYWKAVNCGRNISSVGSDIGSIASKANTITEIVPRNYGGEDSEVYVRAVEKIQIELRTIANELKDVGNRVISSAESIRREEEEEERRRKEAALNSIKQNKSKECW